MVAVKIAKKLGLLQVLKKVLASKNEAGIEADVYRSICLPCLRCLKLVSQVN